MVTHNEAIAQTCDRIIRIEDGRIADRNLVRNREKGGDGIC